MRHRRSRARQPSHATFTRLAAAVRREDKPLVLATLGISFILILLTGLITLRDYPNSGDEYAYQISAMLFAEGKLSVPSPEPKGFFDVIHVVNDGKFYGKYPPGWPFFLSIGFVLGAPWLINPLFGVATLFLVYLIARENFSPKVARIALLLTLFNPFLIFNSASYFAHAAALFFITLLVYYFFRCLRSPSARANYAAMGLAAGAAFLIRPYTAAAVLLPLAAYLLLGFKKVGRPKAPMKLFLLAVAAFLPFLTAFFAYNFVQTGDPLLQPFSKYMPWDGPTLDFGRLSGAVQTTVFFRLSELNRWIPLSLVFVFVYFAWQRRGGKEALLLLPFAGLFTAHLFYPYDWTIYGPRYLYESASTLFVIFALCIGEFNRRRAVAAIVALIVLLNAGLFVEQTGLHSRWVAGNTALYDLVEESGISDAVVFLKTGSDARPLEDLIRNGIHFDASVLYVRDFGPANANLLAAYPGRDAYVYEYDFLARVHRLTPLSAAQEA